MNDYKDLLQKYMRALDEFDGYPDDAIGYGKHTGLLTEVEAEVLYKMWENLA